MKRRIKPTKEDHKVMADIRSEALCLVRLLRDKISNRYPVSDPAVKRADGIYDELQNLRFDLEGNARNEGHADAIELHRADYNRSAGRYYPDDYEAQGQDVSSWWSASEAKKIGGVDVSHLDAAAESGRVR